jgi:CcmD family protein
MSTFVTAYLLVWAAIFWHVLRLIARQSRLEQTARSLSHQVQALQEREEQSRSQAA